VWFSALIPLLSGIFGENGPLGQYFKTKALQVQATADLAMQVERDKLALSSQIAQSAVTSEQNKLLATSQAFKNCVFFMLSAPILICMISPVKGNEIFLSLQIVPVAYMQMYFAIIGIIWGLPIAGNVVTMIMTGLQTAFDAGNDRQVNKIQAIGEQQNMNLDQAKAQIFDIMKKTVGLNGFTQPQVDLISPVLDKVLSIQKEAGK